MAGGQLTPLGVLTQNGAAVSLQVTQTAGALSLAASAAGCSCEITSFSMSEATCGAATVTGVLTGGTIEYSGCTFETLVELFVDAIAISCTAL